MEQTELLERHEKTSFFFEFYPPLLHPLSLALLLLIYHQVMAYITSQVGPACLTQADSEGAAPIHWLCTLGGSMRHAATSAMAMPHERNRSWAHGAPPVRANISSPATSSAAAGAANAKDQQHEGEGKEGERKKDLGVDLRGCSVAVVAKVPERYAHLFTFSSTAFKYLQIVPNILVFHLSISFCALFCHLLCLRLLPHENTVIFENR